MQPSWVTVRTLSKLSIRQILKVATTGFTKYAVEHRIRNIVKKSDKLSSSAYGSSSKAGTAIPRKRKATDAKGNTKKTQKEETASDNAAGLYSQGDSDDIPLSNKAKTTSVLAESQKESIDTGLEAEERVKAEDEDEYAFLFSPNLAA